MSDPLGPAYFNLNVWQNDLKTSQVITNCTRVTAVSTQLALMQHGSYGLSAVLGDHVTGGVTKGMYFELSEGYTAPQTLVASGYVETVQIVDGTTDQYDITAYDASIALENYTSSGGMSMTYAMGYRSVIDLFNGIGGGPGKMGLLPPGWTAVWVDPNGSSAPGNGDDWETDFYGCWQNILILAQHYNFYVRVRPGSKAGSGVLECGPFLDSPSNAEIWGGQPLLDDINQKHGLNLETVNAGIAQSYGYAAIASAAFSETMSGVVNMVWAQGKGDGDKAITLRPLVGGTPLNASGNLANGWAVWTPSGRTLYVKTASKITYNGNQYEFVARQRQDYKKGSGLAGFDFGVVNRTSVATWGLVEHDLKEDSISSSDWLLSASLGHVELNSDPIGQWTFHVQHPFTSVSQVPNIPRPGEAITVHYRGRVANAIDVDTNPASQTYGQFIGIGASADYLVYPGNPLPSVPVQNKLKRLIEIQTTWTAEQGFDSIYTLGVGKWKSKYELDALALRMVKQAHHKNKHHYFKKESFDGVSFRFSQNPTASEDRGSKTITMNPGSIVYSDVPNSSFFDEGHGVEWTATLNDPAQTLRFWFAKLQGTGTEGSPNSGSPYGIFQLALTQSGNRCGFYTTSDGVNYVHRGQEPQKHDPFVFQTNRTLYAGQYRIRVTWHNGLYEAHVTPLSLDGDSGKPFLAARWDDKKVGGSRVIQGFGAIGWYLTGGQSPAVLSAVDAHPHRKRGTASTSSKKGKKHVTITGSGGGHVWMLADEATNTSVSTHIHDELGGHAHTGPHTHGPGSPTTGIVLSSTNSGGTYTVLFNQATYTDSGHVSHPMNPIYANGLAQGWRVQLADGSGTFVVVGQPLRGNKVAVPTQQNPNGRYIVGFTTSSAAASGISVGTQLIWDPIDEGEPVGHLSGTGIWRWQDKNKTWHEGTGRLFLAASAAGDVTKAMILDGHGQWHHATGGQITQNNGAVLQVAPLVITMEHWIHGIERHGAIPFDIGRYDDPNQVVYLYNGSSTHTGTITPNTTNFYGGAPSAIQGSWVTTSTDSQSGDTDSIFQLTVNSTNNTALWQVANAATPAHSLQDEDGVYFSHKITHDESFHFPILVGFEQSSTALNLGAADEIVTTITTTGVSPWTATIPLKYDPAHHGYDSTTHTGVNDTWIVEPGPNADTITITSIDFQNWTMIVTGMQHTHVGTDTSPVTMVQRTAYNGGSPVVLQTAKLDGQTQIGDVKPAIDVVAFGFYATQDGTNYKWFRGWKGEPNFVAPYLGDTTLPGYVADAGMKHLGHLNAKPGQWWDIHIKASEFGLWSKGDSPWTIVAFEMAAYSASPGAGQTIYFDNVSAGHTSHAKRAPAGHVKSKHHGKASVKTTAKHPSHSADGHHHSDLRFWLDSSNVVHWTNGSLVVHNGSATNTYTISDGGTEQSPNASGITATAGDYLIFNASGATQKFLDNGTGGHGNVTVAPHASGAGGFAVVSESYDFTARAGGGTFRKGLPDWCFKIGKVEHTADTYTGVLHFQSHHGSGKKGGTHIQTSAVAKHHAHPNNHGNGHFVDTTFRLVGTTLHIDPAVSGQTPAYWNDLGTQIALGQTTLAVAAGVTVLFDTSNPGGASAFSTTFSGNLNSLANHQKYMKVGHVSHGADAHSKKLVFANYHPGAHQVAGQHVQDNAIGRTHQHPNNPGKHVHHGGLSFEMNAGGAGASTLTVTPGSVDATDGVTSFAVSGRTWAVNGHDYIYIDTSGTSPYTPQNASPSLWNATANQDWIELLRISTEQDADGVQKTEGHHHGPHKVHEFHIKSSAVRTQHVKAKHIGNTHLDDGTGPSGAQAVQKQHITPIHVNSTHLDDGVSSGTSGLPAVKGKHMNYTLPLDWTYLTFLNISPSSGTGSVCVSQSWEWTIIPPIPIERFHAGSWEIGISTNYSAYSSSSPPPGPDLSIPTGFHTGNYDGANIATGTEDTTVSNTLAFMQKVYFGGFDTNLGMLINHVQHDKTNGVIRFKYQGVNKHTSGTGYTMFFFVRWYGHAN